GFLASFVLIYGILEQPGTGRNMRMLMSELPMLVALGPVLMIVVSFLMVSTIPYAAFKQADLFKAPNLRLLFVVAAGLALIYFYPGNALFLFFLTYLLSGFLGFLNKSERKEETHDGPPSHDGLA